jgi:nucleotide-binding universal stress UspA family protein
MSTTEFIVVGMDGSTAADNAAHWAADEAGRRHCELRLIHAFSLPASAGYATSGNYSEDPRPILREAGEQMVERAAADLRVSHPDLTISTKVLDDLPAAALRAESDNAVLTVVGSGNTSRVYGVLLGSVALTIASTNPAPVAVIQRGHSLQTTGPVVVGVDGSPKSEAAVAFAFQAASTRGANLIAVHVWDDIFVSGSRRLQNVMIDPARIEQEERALLAECLAGWSDKYPDVSVEQLVVEGRAAPRLLDQSNNAQLLVVGSHGRGGFSGILLGSTSQSLIIRSHCPVVVVRSAAEK